MGLSIFVCENNILQCGDAILYTYDSIVERKMTISLQIWGVLLSVFVLWLQSCNSNDTCSLDQAKGSP